MNISKIKSNSPSFTEIYKIKTNNEKESNFIVSSLTEDRTIYAKAMKENEVLFINGKDKDDRSNLVNSLSKIFKNKNIVTQINQEYLNRAVELEGLEFYANV